MISIRFGKWTVISEAPKIGTSRSKHYLCKCDCGTEKIQRSDSLKRGESTACKKCGLEKSRLSQITHNMSKNPTYIIWQGLINRCKNKSHGRYHRYGGRGISVDQRWMSFENFLSDMGEKPTGLQIDRIDNDGNYTPSNCQWVTPKQNAANRSTSLVNRLKKQETC